MRLAKQILDQLLATIRELKSVHHFTNGVGLAAPQIGHSLSIAVVRPVGNYPVRLINPRVVSVSSESDVRYEGCLSFFDYRGLVRRPVSVVVEFADLRGRTVVREYHGGLARLVAHEVDHLYGTLYVDLIGNEQDLVDISVYHSRRWDS